MMDRSLLAIGLGVALVCACYTGPAGQASDPIQRSDPTTSPAATITRSSDLPCELAQLLADECASCHGDKPSGGAPNTLLSRADLVAPSLSDPSVTNAELSVTRMRDTRKPMPPDGALPDASIKLLEDWIAQSMPSGSCASITAPGAAYDTPTVCTSKQTWTRGNRGSSDMHPGVACIDCHSRGEGPSYGFAGTVYPTAHEPDDCYGVNGRSTAIRIILTDARGRTFTATASGSGNFGIRASFTPPYRAKVVVGAKTREMQTEQTDGDCNTCHTERGASDAPGRILLP